MKHSMDLLPFEDNEGTLIWKEIKVAYGLRSLRSRPFAKKVNRGRSLSHQFQLGPGEYETYWVEFHCIKGQRIDRRERLIDGSSFFSEAGNEVKALRAYRTKLRKSWELMQFFDKSTLRCSVKPPAWRSRADTEFKDGHDPETEYYIDLIERLAQKPLFYEDNVDPETRELLDRYYAFVLASGNMD